MKSMPDATVA